MKLVNHLTALAAGFAAIAAGQTSGPAAEARYNAQLSYHVTEENRGAFEAWMKDKYRKIAEGVLKEDPSLRTVMLSRLVYGESQDTRANYFLTYMGRGVPKGGRRALQDKVAQRLFGRPMAEVMKEVYPLRTRKGNTVTRQLAGVASGGRTEEGDFLMVDCKKIAEGRMGDYVQLEQQYQPLREAQVKAGKLTSWAMYLQVLPGGTERACDAMTVHSAKDLAQALNWNQGSAALASQLSPPVSLTNLVMRSRDVSTTVRSEGRAVVMVVRQP